MSPSAIPNPNEYDDASYARAVNELYDAIADLWEAGASTLDIEREVDRIIEDVCG